MVIDVELNQPDPEWRVFFDPQSTEYTVRHSPSVVITLKVAETAETGERLCIHLYPANEQNTAQYYVWLPAGFEVLSIRDDPQGRPPIPVQP